MRKGIWILAAVLVWTVWPAGTPAAEAAQEIFAVRAEKTEDEKAVAGERTDEGSAEGQQVRELMEALDVSELDELMEEADLPEDMSFGDLVMDLLEGDGTAWDAIGFYIYHIFFGQWQENRSFLVQILFLVVGFALLKNFARVFDQGYVSQVCFLLVYCLLMVLLMRSLFVLNEVVSDTINTVIDFMTAFIPVFATTMVLVSGDATAAGFYQMGFLVIYILQWVLGYFLVPFVRIYVLVGLINQIMDEAPFGKLSELMSTGILWCLKLVTSLVLGLNIIKNAIAPLQDSLTRSTLRRSLSLIPGVGSTLSAASDLFLASGGIIRNGVGMAALVALVGICAVPLIKLIGMTFLYKLLGAVVEPVADKRVSGALHVVSSGSSMLFRILTTCIILIFLTVAMTTLLGQQMSW